MPKATPAIRTRALPLHRVRSLRPAAAPLIYGALLAAIEFGGGCVLQPMAAVPRAEALLFLAVRPWILALAALAAAHWTWRRRIGLYAAAILIAASAETILLLSFGAAEPWPEMLRGLAAGALVAALADLVVQGLRRLYALAGRLAAVAVLGVLIHFGSGTRPYEALLLGPTAPREAAGPKPPLVLMTSLPIIWGPGGAFDPASRPAETYRALEREFQVTAIDAIEPRALAGRRLMLLAQPRLLAPEELVALDAWVREGGRILILTDPRLQAANEVPLLDTRRLPERGLLGPLLAHWGVELRAAGDRGVEEMVQSGGRRRKLDVPSAGRFAVSGNSCRIGDEPWIARCRIGRGQALLVADADILTDASWVAAGSARGHERHLRQADNPLVVADWLDGLAGIERERADRPVEWLPSGSDDLRALTLASLPMLLAFAAGFGLVIATRRRSSTNLSTGIPTENKSRTEAPPDP